MTVSGILNMPAGVTSVSRAPDDTQRQLDHFLRSVERRAFKIARLRTSDTEEALDIVQDVMMAFVRRYRSKPETEWPPLFFRALDNRITDWYRRRAVRRRWMGFLGKRDDDEVDPIEQAPELKQPDPFQTVDEQEFGTALDRALQDLPERQRQAFLLRSWQGLSTAETAQAMACSEGSVKTHLSRAHHALRDKLAPFSGDL